MVKFGVSKETIHEIKINKGDSCLVVYNNNGKNVGIVWEYVRSKPIISKHQAEIRFFDEFRNEYGMWHKMYNYTGRILYGTITNYLQSNNEYHYVAEIKDYKKNKII